jgi:hypothetical protein
VSVLPSDMYWLAVNALEADPLWRPAQNSLPLRTERCSSESPDPPASALCPFLPRVGARGILGRSSTHPELWKYSLVGKDSTAAPSEPQWATSNAWGGAIEVKESKNARGLVAKLGEVAWA